MHKKRLNPAIIRVGDRVRVKDPRFLVRVGYPKTVADYMETLEPFRPALHKLCCEIAGQEAETSIGMYGFRMPNYVSRAISEVETDLAHMLAQKDGFGGKERTLHLDTKEDLRGIEGSVYSVRSVKTGTYEPSSGYDDDWEPAKLKNLKLHRIAHVHLYVKSPFDVGLYEFPVSHLEKLVEKKDADL